MKRLNILAASLTLSAAAFAANGALANCADELAQLKSEMGSTASAGSAAGGMEASGSSDTMASTNSNGSAGAQSTMSADSGASGNAMSSSGASSSSSGGSQDMAAGTTPGATDQKAVTSDDPTFTASGSNEGQSDRPDSTGALSGVAPTAALTDEASGNDDASQQAAAASASTSGQSSGSGTDDQMTTSATEGASTMSAPEGSSMSGDQTMVSSHVAAAQMALDSGNEEACMAAVEQARQSM